MLRKWFGTRTSRQSARECFFRPELESLEDRLPPSSMQGGDGGKNFHDMNNIHNNVHITDSFNNALNGQNLGLLALPQSNLQGFFTMLYKQAASINSAAANALVADEAQLAIDALLSFRGVSGLSPTISSVQSAIASNSLETSAVGRLLGDVTFDVVLQGLVNSSLASGS
ncbi:MAG: hypothetical protein ACYC3I_03540 [Gemmataceae bacterium]